MMRILRATLLVLAVLAFVECAHMSLARAEGQEERDFAVDQAIGGLEEGSRLLPPEPSGTAGQAAGTRPGSAVSPSNVGTVSESRGVGTPSLGGPGAGMTGGPVSGSQTGSSSVTGGGSGVAPGSGGVETGGGGGAGGTGSVGGGGGGGAPIIDVEVGSGTTDVDVDIGTGGSQPDTSGGAGIEVDVDVDTGTDLGGITEPVTEDADTALDVGVVTDTTTIDASTETTEGNLIVDVSAGSDTLGDALTGTGGELDPDSDSSEEDIGADNDDCNVLDPLSIPEECL